MSNKPAARFSSRAILAFLLGIPLSACATFEGQPRPVISVAMSDETLKSYQVPNVLKEYDKQSGLQKRAYRDEVIAVYTQAIDARYYQFRTNLSAESKSTNLGFDSLLLGLVGAASLSPSDADDIAAITTGVLGLRSSVDKNLYFERTMPALVASMDAERYKIRASIVQHQAADDIRTYPLAAAFVELQEYQQAGTLLAAIGAVTDKAAQARDDAKSDYERRVKFACDSEDEVNVAILPVGIFTSGRINAAAAEEGTGKTTELNRLRAIANAMGINAAGTKSRLELNDAIDDALLNRFCTVDEISALKKALRDANIGFTAS